MKNESCPCSKVTPCSTNCSCSNKLMSGGCARCCSYGSAEQQLNAAVKLANIIDNSQMPTYKFALREDLKNNKEFLPSKGESFASGWDVKAAINNKLVVSAYEYIKIPLGFRAFCPKGWWLELKPRSSSFVKKHLHALYGTIDETFEGEMIFAAQYIPSFDEIAPQKLIINFGDALGQLIPIKRQEMVIEEINNEEYNNLCKERNAERGAGGFGSTDKK